MNPGVPLAAVVLTLLVSGLHAKEICFRSTTDQEEFKRSKWVFEGTVIRELHCTYPKSDGEHNLDMFSVGVLRRAFLRVDKVLKGDPPEVYELVDVEPGFACSPHPEVGQRWLLYVPNDGIPALTCGPSKLLKRGESVSSVGGLFRFRFTEDPRVEADTSECEPILEEHRRSIRTRGQSEGRQGVSDGQSPDTRIERPGLSGAATQSSFPTETGSRPAVGGMGESDRGSWIGSDSAPSQKRDQ